MKPMIPTLVCVAALGLTSVTGSAQTSTTSTSSAKPGQTTTSTTSSSKASTTSKKASKPTTVRASGKLASVDETGKMLTLTTSKGASEQFMLSPATHIS